uniref:Plastocyanin-like domain-containing protein n=1 Tax=Haptolina ericina TaxID=156174 RepID=A0A7S3BEQ4_9EUKA
MALFREYDNEKFELLKHGIKSRGNEASLHLGLQGPVLRAKPGEVIKVVLRNRLRFACNFVISGLSPEGGAADQRPIAPGEVRTLRFVVDATAGPTARDTTDTVAFHYTSDFYAAAVGQAVYNQAHGLPTTAAPGPFADYASGLFGALIVTRGSASHYSDLQPKDVNREFVLFMGILDLNKSPYLDLNIAQFASSPESVDKKDPDFKESNRMHSINGRIYCNLEGLSTLYSRSARWYVFSLGADDAMASPRWSGHAALVHGARVAAPLLQPGMGVVADIDHSNKGVWLLADQTQAHVRAGAAAIFVVKEKITEMCPMAPWSSC